MNRKGDFTVKTLIELILVAIGIAIFIYGVMRVYDANKNLETENARKTIDILDSKIDALEIGEKSSATLQGFPGAENWYIVGWGKSDPDRPEKCLLNACLCICKAGANSATSNCQTQGFCRNLDMNPAVKYHYPEVFGGYAKVGVSVPPGSAGEGIVYERVAGSCIVMTKSLTEVNIEKTAFAIKLDSTSYFTSFPLKCGIVEHE